MKRMYDGHREAMQEAVAGTRAMFKNGTVSREYAAALYLLTGMEYVWPRLKRFVDMDGIDHYGMLEGLRLSSGEELIVSLAGNLFNGGTYREFAPIDLVDHLDETNYELALNGLALRRRDITAADLSL